LFISAVRRSVKLSVSAADPSTVLKTEWPAVARLVAALKARPSFAEICRREGLTEWL
jgi:hypothetical protein